VSGGHAAGVAGGAGGGVQRGDPSVYPVAMLMLASALVWLLGLCGP
jgi:uncharacterized spore protein YtfJ